MDEMRRERRRALLRAMAQFLDALTYADPQMCPFSPSVRATYNGEEVALGHNEVWEEGLRFPSRQTFVDWRQNTAVFFGVVTSEVNLDDVRAPYPKKNFPWNNIREYNRSTSRWWFYFARIHLDGQDRVDEVEELTIEGNLRCLDVAPADYPYRFDAFDWPLPAEDRVDCEEMILAVDSYFNGLDRSCAWQDVLAHPDAVRIEEGTWSARMKQGYHSLRTGFLNPLLKWPIRNRRYVVADEVYGIVIAIVEFVCTEEPGCSPGFVAVKGFKVVDGLFRDIIVTHRPMCLHSGWPGGVDRYERKGRERDL